MASLTPAAAVQRALTNVGRSMGDRRCPTSDIQDAIDDEYRTLRRRLSAEFPTIYEKTSTTVTLAGSTTSFAKPTDCETIRVLEKQAGDRWSSLPVVTSLNRDEVNCLAFYEAGANVVIVPPASAPGTYRMFYIAEPAATVSTYDVPDGIERMLVEMGSAFIRQRHNEDPTYHIQRAEKIWEDAFMGLWRRYGSHGQSGLQITRVW